jgi:WXXGXW repeat (2 copies)
LCSNLQASRKIRTTPAGNPHAEGELALKKIAMAALLAFMMLPAASFAQVVIRIAPPAPIVEHPGPPPSRDFVWIAGYHRWDGGRYVWVPGRWERPPHPHAHWVAAHWAHRHGGWVLIEGRWR